MLPIVSTVSYSLRKEGHDVLTASDGEQALAHARRERPDLILLDLMLPKVDGLEVCRILRQSPDAFVRTVPILMLTAKTDEVDRVVGLEVGADDYVTKPFSMRELVARAKAMLRRSHMQNGEPQPEPVLPLGNLRIDSMQRRVTRKGKELTLKPKEFDLLRFLAQHPGQVFSREQLLDHVWGRGFVGEQRTVDVHVRWLREKIEKNPSRPKLLETIRGVGYRVRAPGGPTVTAGGDEDAEGDEAGDGAEPAAAAKASQAT
ncbi:MAG TPA: response regulator transcription factor [Chloroflexota bacterium]|nr:response regulator transcription factor [Chloroflexota bacterium]